MNLGLQKKKALVTGSSRGIGFAIARRLAEEGCTVTLVARHADALNQAADGIRSAGGIVHTLVADLGKRGASRSMVAEARECMGGLDMLINNVGGNRRGAFVDSTEEDWDGLLELNLRGPIEATREALPGMIAQGSGSVVFISSIFGREWGGDGLSLYHTSKSALIALSKSIAKEVAPHGVRVNTVAPGSIRFPGGSWDQRVQRDPEGMARFVEAHLPLGRFGSAEEVADAVAFLVSERAGLLVGTCLNVDGGQSHSMI
jgi:3-oxoacyl-[acyl-carrier protein] reductase